MLKVQAYYNNSFMNEDTPVTQEDVVPEVENTTTKVEEVDGEVAVETQEEETTENAVKEEIVVE